MPADANEADVPAFGPWVDRERALAELAADDEPTAARLHEQTMVVYRQWGGLLHLPLVDEETTVCGQPLDWFERRDHPLTHAGLWCTDCMKGATDRVA